MQQQKEIEWLAYCVPCGRVIYHAPNGAFVQAAAERHVKEVPHVFEGPGVIVGFDITAQKKRERK